MTDTRFEGVTGGEEYQLFLLSATHIPAMEAAVGNILASRFANSTLESIRVLEVGVGTGITTVELLRADSRFAVTGIDFEPKMIEVASRNFAGEPRVSLEIAGALEFLQAQPDDSFDALASGFCIHNFQPEYRLDVIREIPRVLKSGGALVNLDKYALDDMVQHYKSLYAQLGTFDVYLTPEVNRPDVYEEWFRHYLEDELVKITEGEQIRMLEALGFTGITFRDRFGMDAILEAYAA